MEKTVLESTRVWRPDQASRFDIISVFTSLISESDLWLHCVTTTGFIGAGAKTFLSFIEIQEKKLWRPLYKLLTDLCNIETIFLEV